VNGENITPGQSVRNSMVKLPPTINTKMKATDENRTVIELEVSPRFRDTDCQTPREIGGD